jgi:uncharacterized zinc-type alcohol dehydrogenase-like protein
VTRIADHNFVVSDPGTFPANAGKFDLIVNTASANLDIPAYLSLLAVDGARVNVGAPPAPLSVNVMSLVGGPRSFAGSMIGGIALTREMLDFCSPGWPGVGALSGARHRAPR